MTTSGPPPGSTNVSAHPRVRPPSDPGHDAAARSIGPRRSPRRAPLPSGDRPVRWAAAVALVALTLAGCSSSGGDNPTASAPPTVTEPRATPSAPASTSTSTSTSTTSTTVAEKPIETLPPTTAAPPTSPPTTEASPPPTQAEICSEATLAHLEDVLWNRWFDEQAADPQSSSPGYLLYAKDVLYPFTTSDGQPGWSLKPGTISIYEYNPNGDYLAFSFEPDDFQGEFLAMGVVADSSGLIGSIEYHEGSEPSGAVADRLRGPFVIVDAWDGTSGRLGLECA